ncbi:MAG: cytochrome C oxidase subunit IV family protein [Myxococcales bacterium]|nr:cytochrome C oxidase subunit IV family protein [Myxococcales bacterium]
MSDEHEHHDHTKHYMKIYWILMVLFIISCLGPEIGVKWLTLITAFGIAVVKAYLVAAHFMHLNIEKKYVNYLLLTAVAFMFLFYAGTAPDVMKHSGRQWENVAAQEEVKRALAEAEEGGDHGHH